ncbi:MAG: sugar-binding domain-containing protein, partial [Phycisphaerae bacterium]
MLHRRELIKAGLTVAASASLAELNIPAHGQSVAVTAVTAATGPRRRELLDANWRFQALAAKVPHHAVYSTAAALPQASAHFNDDSWRLVQLPHDYIVEGKYNPKASKSHGFLPVYAAWYRRHFSLGASESRKAVWLDFEGVYRDAHVYLNGKFLGRHQGGYTPFRFDIGKTANFGGDNVLAVYVDPTEFEGWWYEGGGIYRHVWLNVADPVHVIPWGVYVISDV